MRVYALYLVATIIAIYAWRDWFKSLCGLILLMSVIVHEDMPKSIMGIPGLNPWNVLFFDIFLAWLVSRRREGLKWDMPRYINVLLLLYLGVILVGFLRMVFDRTNIEGYSITYLISDKLINTLKWVLPGVLLFDGCRTRRRLRWVVVSLLIMYFFLAAQVIRRMPLESALGGAGERIQHHRLKVCKSIGYSAVNMSVILAGVSWAIIATLPLFRRRIHKIAILAAAGTIAFGQALTGGRAGYLAWGAVGFILCLLKWRKYLVLAPVVLILLFFAFPAAAERALWGFGETDVSGQSVANDYMITSGRTQIWTHVIDKINESLMFGYGRLAMVRTGLTEFLGKKYGESETFPHPHNMYLESLLDNGVVGFVPIILFFIIVVVYSARLFRDPNPWCAAVGGMALSLVLAQLFGGIGSQHVYPSEGTLGMWIAIFLMFRVSLEQSRLAGRTRVAISSRPSEQTSTHLICTCWEPSGEL